MWFRGEFIAIRTSVIAALNIRGLFYRMTECVCSCCWTGWCCYWLDKSMRSDSGWCLPWFSLSWWVDMMQREACSVRTPYCLLLWLLVYEVVFFFLSQCFFFFLLISVSTCALVISQAAFPPPPFLPSSFVLSVLSLPLGVIGWMARV